MQLRKRSGFLLVLTVTVGGLLLLMGIGMVQMCSDHMGMIRHAEHMGTAQAAAEGALQEALYQVSQNPAYNSDLSVSLSRSGAVGKVSFQNSSLNNWNGTGAALASDGRSVPAGMVYLVAQGSRGNGQYVTHGMLDPGRLLMQSDFTVDAAGWNHAIGILPQVLLGQFVVGVNLPLTRTEQWEFAGSPAWNDYRVDAEATITTGTGLGIFFLADSQTSTNAYLFDYDLLDDALQGGAFGLHKVVNGVIQPAFAKVDRNNTCLAGLLSWLLNLKRTYSVKVHDNEITCYVDGQQVLKVTDDTRYRGVGMIGLHAPLNTIALVDKVTVRSNFEMKAQW